jgi:hypothetical protein
VHLVWELVVGGSACAALLLLRRRWPVGLALVLIIASPLSALGLGAALMAVFTVATGAPGGSRSPSAGCWSPCS